MLRVVALSALAALAAATLPIVGEGQVGPIKIVNRIAPSEEAAAKASARAEKLRTPYTAEYAKSKHPVWVLGSCGA